jgi:hypothetical protein
MPSTSPARIDDDLYESAKLAGDVQSRSASQQVVHWARIGREIEASSSITHRDVAEVLAGARSYDSLTPKEQAVVRATWAERMDILRRELDLARDFASAGRTWVELDERGAVVERESSPAATARQAAKPRVAKTTSRSTTTATTPRRRTGRSK